jgi:hypothetical protein
MTASSIALWFKKKYKTNVLLKILGLVYVREVCHLIIYKQLVLSCLYVEKLLLVE